MDERIFGYPWEAIQAAQQGGRLSAGPTSLSRENWSDSDQQLLKEFGSAHALADAGFHGTADRVTRGIHLREGDNRAEAYNQHTTGAEE